MDTYLKAGEAVTIPTLQKKQRKPEKKCATAEVQQPPLQSVILSRRRPHAYNKAIEKPVLGDYSTTS